MSSNGSIPGTADWVVNGNGPASLREPVSAACNVDLPEFGGRTRHSAAAQEVVRLRLVLHEVRDRERDLVVDVVVLRFELGKDADFGNEQIGIRNARLVEVARQHRAVLDRETMQRGAARKERADLRFDVGFEADEEDVGKAGLEIEGLHL